MRRQEEELIMTPEIAIKTIDMAIANVEWEYPMDYAAAFDYAKEAINKQILNKTINMCCPVCHTFIPNKDLYCSHCGQKVRDY